MTSFYLTVIHRPEMVPEYLQKEAEEGKAVDLTMSEFADVYRENWPYARPEMTLWKDILYGSKRQQFWFADPWMRFCLDMNQGGAMIDLQPYAAKLIRPCGVGTAHIQDASSSATQAKKWTCAPAELRSRSLRTATRAS